MVIFFFSDLRLCYIYVLFLVSWSFKKIICIANWESYLLWSSLREGFCVMDGPVLMNLPTRPSQCPLAADSPAGALLLTVC